MSTFGGTVILDVNYGIYFGLASSILVVVIQSQRAYTAVLGRIPNTELYEDVFVCDTAIEYDFIKIIRFESPIFYANVDNFSHKIIKFTGINPRSIIHQINKKNEKSLKHKVKQNKLDKTDLPVSNDFIKVSNTLFNFNENFNY